MNVFIGRFEKDRSTGSLILRLILGAVMFAHGAQKLLGWFGGPGLATTINMMGSGPMGISPILIYMSVLAEFLGGIAMLLGLFTRFFAVAIFINMLVAVALVHLKNGFVGQGGYEYPLTLALIALANFFMGPGQFSLDHAMWREGRTWVLRVGRRKTVQAL